MSEPAADPVGVVDVHQLARTPAAAVVAEEHVLGSVLLTGGACLDSCPLTPADFYRPAHQALWGLLTGMSGQGMVIDPTTVRARIDEQPDAAPGVGWELLHRVIAGVPTPANAGWYARIVRDAADLRRVREAGVSLTQSGSVLEAARAREHARRVLDELDGRDAGGDAVSTADLLVDFTRDLETAESPMLSTPWPDLDRIIGGLRPGSLYVIGARPGVGKSLVGLNLAWHVAHRHQRTVLLHSLEMPRRELMCRLVAAVASVDHDVLSRRLMTEKAWDRYTEVSGRIAGAPLLIDDRAGVRVGEVRGQARVAARGGNLGLVVVDYLQLLAAPGDGRVSREQQVAECSRSLKLLAKDLGVPVVLLAQLNRQVEGRADPHPRLSDLRESGAVEQDADVVLLLYRDLDAEGPEADVLEISVAKHRQGAMGSVSLCWQGRFMRAVSMSRLRVVS